MFDEPDEPKAEAPRDPAQRAKEKAEEFCLHAEVAAVFEGPRKFDAAVRADLDPELARDVQRAMAKLAKAKAAEHPILPPEVAGEAARVLNLAEGAGPPLNDYHIYRRPGEVMVVRWLEGGLVDAFYERMQAHFNAALEGCREDERQAHGWKQDPDTQAYLKALDAVELKMADRYLRDVIRQHKVFVLSTVTVDEMNVSFLAEDVMGAAVADLVGAVSAPSGESGAPSDRDRAWYFKLFALRGMTPAPETEPAAGAGDGVVERMCFFAFLQKTDDSFGDW